MITKKDVVVPATVPEAMRETYVKNYLEITRRSGNLMLFAGDQKTEHMNDDYYGEGISEEDATPEHLFKIASKANIGCFATHLGLISRYGNQYSDIPYLVKLNTKTNLLKDKDPYSGLLSTATQVAEFKENSELNILGIGYTLYTGSKYESLMMSEIAEQVYEAHQYGLVSVIWSYPRGRNLTDGKDVHPHTVAGAAGVAACMGADFTKVNYKDVDPEPLKEAVLAAGNTGLVCAGGSKQGVEGFLKDLYDKIHIAGARGNATGRNIHQRPLEEAVRFTNAIYAITVDGASVEDAMKIYEA